MGPRKSSENDVGITQTAFRAAIIKEAERLAEDCTYASKSQFNDGTWWDRVHLAAGFAAAILGAVAGTTGLVADRRPLSAILALLGAAVTAVVTFQKPGERAATHRAAGVGYNAVRERARRLHLVDALGPSSDKELRKQLDEIAAEKIRVSKQAPAVSSCAFTKARKGIEEGEARHVIDDKTPPVLEAAETLRVDLPAAESLPANKPVDSGDR